MLLSFWLTIRVIAFFVWDHWRVTVPVILIVTVVGWLLITRGCGRPPAKLNEPEIHAAQKAIADEDREQMTKILAESDAREKVIMTNQGDAEAAKAKAIEESKKKWANADNQAMADELNRRASQ